MHLIFLDVETTGAEPTRDRIIEIGAMRIDGRSLAAVDGPGCEWNAVDQKVQFDDSLMTPQAAEINGYKRENWAKAVPLPRALDALDLLAEGAILAGHNVAFDRNFLFAECARLHRAPPRFDGYRVVDTASLAWPLVLAGEIETMSIAKVASRFGLELPPHNALGDVLLEIEVYRRLTMIGLVGIATVGPKQLAKIDWTEACRAANERLQQGEGG